VLGGKQGGPREKGRAWGGGGRGVAKKGRERARLNAWSFENYEKAVGEEGGVGGDRGLNRGARREPFSGCAHLIFGSVEE
jgi:hypothetical protein